MWFSLQIKKRSNILKSLYPKEDEEITMLMHQGVT